MNNQFNIFVGLHHPSKYDELNTKLTRKSISNHKECSKGDFNNNIDHLGAPKQQILKYNITVGKLNPNESNFKPMRITSILKQSKSGGTKAFNQLNSADQTNLDYLTQFSSYDFSNTNSNNFNKSYIPPSGVQKTVTFSAVNPCDNIIEYSISPIPSDSSYTSSAEGSNQLESTPDPLSKSPDLKARDLLDVLRNAVKTVINVNRLINLRIESKSEFLGPECTENVGFGDHLTKNGTLNVLGSIADETIMNKVSRDSVSQMVALNNKNNYAYCHFNSKLLKIKQKYEFIENLLDELGDPVKLIKNDAPLSNIMEEQTNTTRLVHPIYINYYPKKEEVVEHEFESDKLCRPTKPEMRIIHISQYPSMMSIFLNAKNGITSV